MKYDFDKETNRLNKDSLKWNVKENELPMWVADMDFETAPFIKEDLAKRVEEGIFGYNEVSDNWYEAYINFWQKRHHFSIKKEWMMFCLGVVPAISSIVRRVTSIGDFVVLLTPTYNIFFNSIINNGRHPLESKLTYKNHKYSIDFADLENKLKDPLTTLFILCNPHNPIGKIWDKKTLKKIGDLCYKYNVLVLSDEIHCDLVDPNKEYIPFASISKINQKISLTCISVSKAFNLAGIQTAAIIVPDKFLFNKVNRAINSDEIAEPNSFAQVAVISALTKGEDYLDQLRNYIFENKKFVREQLKHFHGIKVIDSDATYLLWIDISALKTNANDLCTFIREKTGLYLSNGEQFKGNGKYFIRMNVATQRYRVVDGIKRFKNAIEEFINL